MVVIKTKPHADFPRRFVDTPTPLCYNKLIIKQEKAL